MRALSVVFALLVAVPSHALSQEMTETERSQREAEVKREIQAQTDALWAALFNKDARAAATFWTSDGEIIEAEGWFEASEIEGFLGEFFRTGAITAGTEEFLEWFIRGDVIYTISLASETIEIEGQEPFTLRKFCTKRWVREDGAWKMKRTVNGRVDLLAGG